MSGSSLRRTPAQVVATIEHRPFLPSDPNASGAACDPAQTNGSSLAGIRQGKPYADGQGNLEIRHVADATDGTQNLSAGYGGFCTSAQASASSVSSPVSVRVTK